MKQQAKIKDKGFTLIELMVAMVISIIVMGAIYAVYLSQTRVQVVHEVTLELQESLRSVLTIMEKEIRTAGADPTGNADARIILANHNEIRFTRDIDDDTVSGRFDGAITQPNEDIRYAIRGDGHLGRITNGDAGDGDILLENVDALNFVYWGYGADNNPKVLNPEKSDVDADGLDDIKRVDVTIVARSGQSDRGFLGFGRHTDTVEYKNQEGLEEDLNPDLKDRVVLERQNDNARRLQLSTSVTCRNMPK